VYLEMAHKDWRLLRTDPNV